MRVIPSLVLAAALTVPAMAQWGPYDNNRPGYGGYGGYGRDRGMGNRGAMDALNRVEQDLRYMASRGGGGWFGRGSGRFGYNDSHARNEINKALNDVMRAHDDWQRKGRVNSGKLNSASRHMEKAMSEGRLSGQDRDMLSRDISLLRSFRW